MLVEGHTCDLPINTPQFPSNWELSAARACAVMVFLIRQCEIAPEHISATGYGATRPRVPNTSEANRRRNRRVDIVIVPDESMPGSRSGAIEATGCDEVAGQHTGAIFEPIQIMPPMTLAAEWQRRQAGAATTDSRPHVNEEEPE